VTYLPVGNGDGCHAVSINEKEVAPKDEKNGFHMTYRSAKRF